MSAEELSDDSAINLVGTNQDHLDQNSESSEIPSTEGQQEVSEEESSKSYRVHLKNFGFHSLISIVIHYLSI